MLISIRKRLKTIHSIFWAICLSLCISQLAYASRTTSASEQPPALSADLWQDIAKSFQLNHYSNNPVVAKQITWYMQHQEYLYTMAERSAPYLYYIHQETQKRHLPGELVLLPMVESAYNPFAYSSVGAAGLWQFMPGTAAGFGLQQDWWYDGRRDVMSSTEAALHYLTYLHKFLNNDWILAMAAYDTGEGAVQHAILKNKKKNKPTDFWSLKLSHETKAYIPKILALATIISNPQKYQVELPAIPNKPYFDTVDVGYQIELAKAAELADISLDELYQLNPGYNRWATGPNGPYTLLLPTEKIATFKEQLAENFNHQVTWVRYQVKAGDSLSKIAHQQHTTINTIKKANNLKNNHIRIGQKLMVPRGAKTISATKLSHAKHNAMANKHVHPPDNRPTQIKYTVKANDALWKIAKHYHVKPAEIRFWNHLSQRDAIHPGQVLEIWQRHPHSHNKPRTKHYTVASGDSLSKIAHQHHMTVHNLKKMNHLNSNMIRVGQTLLIPS